MNIYRVIVHNVDKARTYEFYVIRSTSPRNAALEAEKAAKTSGMREAAAVEIYQLLDGGGWRKLHYPPY